MAGPKSFFLTPEAHGYLVAHGEQPDDVLQWLQAETAKLGGVSAMQIAPEQGNFLTMLTRLIGAHRAVEGRVSARCVSLTVGAGDG